MLLFFVTCYLFQVDIIQRYLCKITFDEQCTFSICGFYFLTCKQFLLFLQSLLVVVMGLWFSNIREYTTLSFTMFVY